MESNKDSHNTTTKDGNKKKRGLKPRSQRNRKRPTLSNDHLTFETEICRLALKGKPVKVANPWIRIVKPYPYTFATFAKARWNGRTVLDVYSSEFGSFPKSYYVSAIQQGRILVSDNKVDLDYKIKGGDVLSHTVHRHEPAVAVSSKDGIEILEETSELVVVDKPGTLPVHPCGGYHMNSLSHILEPCFGKLHNINRLDRLTSGLVLLAKSSAVAQKLGKCIMQRDSCQKLYLAVVKGKFPLNCTLTMNQRVESDQKLPCKHGEWISLEDAMHSTSDATSKGKPPPKTVEEMRDTNALGAWITSASGKVDRTASLQQVFDSQRAVDTLLDELGRSQEEKSTTTSPDKLHDDDKIRWLHLSCPTRVAKPKDGICEAGSFDDLESDTYVKTVKPAQTAFSVVKYSKGTDSTIVMCQPVTGRTHQIRLHLQYLGHPIANDPSYGGDMFFGDANGQDAFEAAKSRLNELNDANVNFVDTNSGANEDDTADSTLPATSTDTPATQAELNAVAELTRSDDEALESFIKRSCVWCARGRGEKDGNERAMLEFLCRSSGIYLHAFAYDMVDDSGQRVQYKTKLPPWAI